MIRAWIGVACLAASWLLGLRYYHSENWLAWAVTIVLGVILLFRCLPRLPGQRECTAALVLFLPAVWVAQGPYLIGPLLVVLGLAMQLAPLPRNWPKSLAVGMVAAGLILLTQAVSLELYQAVTARSHELCWPLPQLISGISQYLGIDAGVSGSSLALHSMRKAHAMGATWELFFDPVSVCFLTGGLLLLALQAWSNLPPHERLKPLLVRGAVLCGCVLGWLPVRTGLMLALFIHRFLRIDYDAEIVIMDQFWNPWLHLLLLSGPVFLAWRFLPALKPADAGEAESPAAFQPPLKQWLKLAALAFFGAAFWTAAAYYDPVGKVKQGRIIVDEYHSEWEPTERPYDTEWYGNKSGYNYACIYDYCSRFYEMDRLNAPLDNQALTKCDVLMLKTPTSPYGDEEVRAIRTFVKEGGGLLLVGEHTNVFGTGTYLNQVADTFGFRFGYDCLFDIDDLFNQQHRQPLVPHPIIQSLPELDLAVSCSIEPGFSQGRAIIRSTGLRNLPADYHASNFYPQIEDRAAARYGAFIQLWAKRHGTGRVMAFTDSTIFSNFGTFEPGKAELMLGMLEWLNHKNRFGDPFWVLAVLGLGLLLAAVVLRGKWDGAWLLLSGAVIFGWAMTCLATGALNRAQMPLPEAKRPMVKVAIDRTMCSSPLPVSGFIGGKSGEFGIFERWILRLGYFTVRTHGAQGFASDLIIFMHPDQEVSVEFREQLIRYVEEGGKALIIDAPQNAASQANYILGPFGLSVDRTTNFQGELKTTAEWPSIKLTTASKIAGGEPFAWIEQTPVGASAQIPVGASVKFGEGQVIAIGFGERFTDPKMGVTGDIIPGPELLEVYDVQFSMLRAIIDGTPLASSTEGADKN